MRQSTDEVGLQWDGAEHFCVSSSQQMYYDDAFSLVMVRSRNNTKVIIFIESSIHLHSEYVSL